MRQRVKTDDSAAVCRSDSGKEVRRCFFTTKEAGEGTGLGLSLVFSIVEDLGGDIDIISPINKSRGTGTQVVVWFSEYHDDSDTEIERHEEAQFRRSG